MTGANCHYSIEEDRMQIAAAVTDLEGNIIFSNYKSDSSNGWIISGVKSYKTRFWAAGSCTIVLTRSLENMNELPSSFPRLLSPERQFCIYLGWIDSPRKIVKRDLTNGNLIRDFVGVVDTIQFSGTGEGGQTIKIEARDRMKWLLDSEIYYIATQSIPDGGTSSNLGRSTILRDIALRAVGKVGLGQEIVEDEEEDTGNEEDIENEEDEEWGIFGGIGEFIEDTFTDLFESDEENATTERTNRIEEQAENQQEREEQEEQQRLEDCNAAGCGITIRKPKDSKFLIDVVLDSDTPDSNVWYRDGGPLAGSTTTIGDLKLDPSPEFRIYTTRAAGKVDQLDQNFLINQQYPIEMIRFLSFQEVYPTEVFQHTDGHIYYVPRSVDGSAIKRPNGEGGDPKRFYRTYYYQIKDSETVNVNQSLINFREERSTLSTKTNFIVENTGDGDLNATEFFYHLRAIPKELSDVGRFACKFQRIKDPSITKDAEAAMVALSAARRTARETRAGMATCIGDPSFSPGEVIQVLGSPLIDKGGIPIKQSDRAKFFDYKEGTGEGGSGGWDNLIKLYVELSNPESDEQQFDGETAQRIPLVEDDREVEFVKSDNTDVGDYLCKNISKIKEKGSDKETTFGEEPPTIFRVEAVVQKFQLGSAGFTTELALVSPF